MLHDRRRAVRLRRSPGYLKDPGFPKYDLKKATKLADEYKAAHGGEFNVVLEHTNDPANAAEAELIKQQLAKAGIDATLEAATTRPPSSSTRSAELQHHAVAQPPRRRPRHAVRVVDSTGIRCSTSARSTTPSCRRCSTRAARETDPAKRKAIYQQVEQGFVEAGLQHLGLLHPVGWSRDRRTSQGLAGPPLPDGGQAACSSTDATPVARDVLGRRSRHSGPGCGTIGDVRLGSQLSSSSSSSSSTLFAFSLLRLFPGDVADAVHPVRHRRRRRQQFREDNGLDKPFFEQYATWLGNLVQGDLGKDYQSERRRSSDKLETALPVSLQLMLYAQIIALVVAIPLGVFTAYRANTMTDREHQHRRVRAARAAELRARARARVLRRREVETRLPFLGQIPVTATSRAGSKALFGQPSGDLGEHFGTMCSPRSRSPRA